MSTTTHVDFYNVSKSKSKNVSLTINTGFGQNSTSSIYVGSGMLDGGGPNGAFTEEDFTVDLGTNYELNGKKLIITISVQDIQPHTDESSITLRLTGGVSDYKKLMTATIDKQTKVVFYTYYIMFH